MCEIRTEDCYFWFVPLKEKRHAPLPLPSQQLKDRHGGKRLWAMQRRATPEPQAWGIPRRSLVLDHFMESHVGTCSLTREGNKPPSYLSQLLLHGNQ